VGKTNYLVAAVQATGTPQEGADIGVISAIFPAAVSRGLAS
jgi:hypothetical protein